MKDILEEIVANTKNEVAARKQSAPLATLQELIKQQSTARDFFQSLAQPGIRIIAECKKMSPSKGVMVADYDPIKLARAYEAGGAAAISVLTDQKYFGGHLLHLKSVREAVDLPVMRKDFIIDAYQIYEARSAGADSFLLLSGVLTPEQIEDFLQLGRSLGMEALVESHSEEQLDACLKTSARIIGINNRNLKTFAVDFSHAKAFVQRIKSAKPDSIPVCESGVREPKDIAHMKQSGFQTFLIGEAVATAPDPREKVASFVAADSM